MAQLNRDRLPDWRAYAAREGLLLQGPGPWVTAECHIHGGSDSLRVNLKTNGWCCMACGAKGGDVLAHYMQRTGADFQTAAQALGALEEPGTPGSNERRRTLPARDALELLYQDALLVWVAAGNLARGVALTDADRAALAAATRRVALVSQGGSPMTAVDRITELRKRVDAAAAANPRALADALVYAPHVTDEPDLHRNAPRPDLACLYGLVGMVARAGSETTEANPFAIALNFIAYMSAAIGRGPFMPIGNTYHHARVFGLHIGRTGRGRKGDAASLVHRLDKALRGMDAAAAPQVHRGGLSTREGLAMLIHDGYIEGKKEVEPIHDKRLWVQESEFVNVLAQSKRDGNTLSAAMRDAFDGVDMRPATKTNRLWASNPHIAVSAAITPNELRGSMASRDLTNGFANRFLMIWAERTQELPFPQATPQHVVDSLAERISTVLEFAGAKRYAERDAKRMTIRPEAASRYATLYRGELNDQSAGEVVSALLERRAPILLRLAMIFALTDQKVEIDTHHIDAALAWVRYWCDSVKFVFASAVDEAGAAKVHDAAAKIIEFLKSIGKATRTQIGQGCFQGHAPKTQIDAAIDVLLAATPPRIVIDTVPRPKASPGAPTKFYSLAANSANSANCQQACGFEGASHGSESSEASELTESSFRAVRTDRTSTNQLASHAGADDSLNSHISQARDVQGEVL